MPGELSQTFHGKDCEKIFTTTSGMFLIPPILPGALFPARRASMLTHSLVLEVILSLLGEGKASV